MHNADVLFKVRCLKCCSKYDKGGVLDVCTSVIRCVVHQSTAVNSCQTRRCCHLKCGNMCLQEDATVDDFIDILEVRFPMPHPACRMRVHRSSKKVLCAQQSRMNTPWCIARPRLNRTLQRKDMMTNRVQTSSDALEHRYKCHSQSPSI